MTHIYQPVMIKTLLQREGRARTEDIARAFLNADTSQLEYYKAITKRWPHQTLKKHGIVSYSREEYTLLLNDITRKERESLIDLCELRIQEFIDKDPWIRNIRKLDNSAIQGSMRYDVLARYRGLCAACGASGTTTPLDVDHIIPRSMGGPTILENLQVLCQRCNREKRNRDETDFVLWHNRLKFRRKECPLCDPKDIMAENHMASAITIGQHIVVLPKRHVSSFFEMLLPERNLCFALADSVLSKSGKTASKVTIDPIPQDGDMHHSHIGILTT